MADYEQQQDESQYEQQQEQGDQEYAVEEQAPVETENNIDNYNSNNSTHRGNNNRGGNRGGSGRGGNFRGAPRGRGRGDFQPRGRGGFQSRGGGGGGGGFAGQKRGFQDQYSGNVSGMEFVKKRKVNDNVHRMLVPVKSVKTIIGPKGESIKALKDDAGEGCKISIYTQSTNKVPLPEGTSERVISIEGDMDQLKKCLVDIIPKVQGVPIERVRGKLTLKLMIPEHCCSMVIGPKGANSKQIREETGSTVQVFTDPLPGSGEHVVQLRNQELDQIVAAAVRVFEIIREGKSQNNVLLFEPHIWTPGEFGTTGSYHDDSFGAYGNQGGNQGGFGGNQGGNQQYYNNQGNNQQQSYDDQSYYNEDQSYYNEQGSGYYEEEAPQGGYDNYNQGAQGGYQEEYVEPAYTANTYQAPAPRGRGGRARGPLLGSSPGNRGAARGGSAPPSRGNFAGSRGGRGANGSPRGAPRGGAPRGAPRGGSNRGGDSRGFSRGGRGAPRGAPRGGSRGRGGQY